MAPKGGVAHNRSYIFSEAGVKRLRYRMSWVFVYIETSPNHARAVSIGEGLALRLPSMVQITTKMTDS